jgi:hypothetical protein
MESECDQFVRAAKELDLFVSRSGVTDVDMRWFKNVHRTCYEEDTVACRPVARRRPRDRRLYSRFCWAAAGKQQQMNGVFCAVRQATIEQQQRNGFFCAVRAEML